MLKNKKYLLWSAIAVLIILAMIIFILLRPKAERAGQPLKNLDIGSAQAQTYAAGQVPSLAKDDKIFGSTKAPLKIFVYEDYSDLYSARLADNLDKARADFGEQLAIIVRPYVLKSSPLAVPAAQAVLCAGEQEKWMEMRALLFAQAKNNRLALANFGAYAQQIGLDETAFGTCLTNQEKSEKIEQAVQAAGQYNILGAPTMFVGSEMILGARPYENYTDSNKDQIEGLKTVISRLINK
jgi:protein-disulfide isomerase